jgi:hypothetical protein
MATPLRDRYIGNANVFGGAEVDLLTRYGGGTVHDVTDPLHDLAAEAGLDDVSTMQYIDINTWLPGDVLVKADRMSMAHGLELRVPFLDREVMGVASRLARADKTAATMTKFALREAIGTLLPHETVDQAKRGFTVPIGHWLQGELSGFAEQVIREARTEDWLDKRAVLDVLRQFRAGDPEVTWRQVWVLVVFSLWHQIYVERVFDPVAQGWQTMRSAQPGRVQAPSAPPPAPEGRPPAGRPQPRFEPAQPGGAGSGNSGPHPGPGHSGPHASPAQPGQAPPGSGHSGPHPGPAQPRFEPRHSEQPR